MPWVGGWALLEAGGSKSNSFHGTLRSRLRSMPGAVAMDAYQGHDVNSILNDPLLSKTSCEIIQEAKNSMMTAHPQRSGAAVGVLRDLGPITSGSSLRTVHTRRPFTPKVDSRTLFGGSLKTGTFPGRPSSTFSISSLQLDPDSRCSTSHGNRLAPLPKYPSPSRQGNESLEEMLAEIDGHLNRGGPSIINLKPTSLPAIEEKQKYRRNSIGHMPQPEASLLLDSRVPPVMREDAGIAEFQNHKGRQLPSLNESLGRNHFKSHVAASLDGDLQSLLTFKRLGTQSNRSKQDNNTISPNASQQAVVSQSSLADAPPLTPSLQRGPETRNTSSVDKQPETRKQSRPSSAAPSISDSGSNKKPRQEVTEKDNFWRNKLKPLLVQVQNETSDDPEIWTELLRQVYSVMNEGGYVRGGNLSSSTQSQTINKSHRPHILKILFPLVEKRHPKVLLQLARILLAISREPSNDTLFLEGNILDLFLTTIGSCSPTEESEACLFGYGALKFLTLNAHVRRRLHHLGAVELMVLHLKMISALREESPSSKVSEQTTSVMFQLTNCLRHLAKDEATYPNFISSGAIKECCRLCDLFSTDLDIVSHASRILSVLATDEKCCDVMIADESSMPIMASILRRYPSRQDIVVRLGYVLGNMVARSAQCRSKFLEIDGGVDALLDILSVYIRRDIKETSARGKLHPSDKQKEGKDKEKDRPGIHSTGNEELETDDEADGSRGTSADVLVKVIRVLANMAIEPAAGKDLAKNHRCIDYLLSVIRHKDVQGREHGQTVDESQELSPPDSKSPEEEEAEECILSALAALNNLAFYSTEANSAIGDRATEVAEYLCDLLLLNQNSIQVEVVRVLGSLSRARVVRDLIANRKVFRVLIGMLDWRERSVVYSVCGVLVNMMTDEDRRKTLKDMHGLLKLYSVLRDMGCHDWLLSSVICQVFWNACAGIEDPASYFGEQLCNELSIILEDYLDEETAFGSRKEENGELSEMHTAWDQFCLVAAQLLDRIDVPDNASTTTDGSDE
ncbi:unnamed protein product [Cyprideis torosa]|uniref:Uncharacterized protein n=1 Tax=Cyprideis torosa TaxID=163714 RepID=A0A7R8ZLD4_9CRUS|nr:unnamed protein product [Cyprideis torosa]CAG0891538.1 unnamed protein product [Cyprideis torosa]